MKIKIKKYIDDPTLTWEERYKRLEAHHLEETKVLIAEIEELENRIYEMNIFEVEQEWYND